MRIFRMQWIWLELFSARTLVLPVVLDPGTARMHSK